MFPSVSAPLCVPLSPQSFCASLHQELKEYYRLLSVLHSQVLRDESCPESHLIEKMVDNKITIKHVTHYMLKK